MSSVANDGVEVEESTPHHWVAWSGNLVIVFVYEGSHDDTAHVVAGARVIERLHRRLRAPLRLLFVIPSMLGKAPSARVRSAIVQAARRLGATVSHAALVVLGSGFGPALHRGAATGLIAILRPSTLWKIDASVSGALAFLLGEAHPDVAQITRRCEEELRAHAIRAQPISLDATVG